MRKYLRKLQLKTSLTLELSKSKKTKLSHTRYTQEKKNTPRHILIKLMKIKQKEQQQQQQKQQGKMNKQHKRGYP